MSHPRETVWLIVVAGGRGERLGAGVPKGFVELAGRPLFSYALESAARSGAITRAVLVAHPEPAWEAARRLGEATRRLLHGVVCGGEERHDSVREGLHAVRAATQAAQAVAGDGPLDPVVLVHDAARPFASPDLYRRMAAAAAEEPAVCVRPVPDTVKEVDEGYVVRSLAREQLALAQTPQGARLSLLELAHGQRAAGAITDDAMLLEALGTRVRAVPGEASNFKITTPEDLRLAEAWVRAGGAPWM